jgi:hypothetical protein
VRVGRLYISRDVVFDEKTFPFVALHSTAGASYSFDVLLLPDASIGNNLTTDADESSTCFPLPVFGSCVQSQVAATSGSASVPEVAGPDPMPNPPPRSTATPARALPSTTSSTAPVVHRRPRYKPCRSHSTPNVCHDYVLCASPGIAHNFVRLSWHAPDDSLCCCSAPDIRRLFINWCSTAALGF